MYNIFFREGETVILKCLIQAHPWVYRILWYRDGEEIVASDRIFIDEQQVQLSRNLMSIVND